MSRNKSRGEHTDVIALIENQLETLGVFKEYASERERLAADAEARSSSLPSADATDKLLRYEAHLDRQLYRAIDQLERLQRQRKGENVPPPINLNLGRRAWAFLRNKAKKFFEFSACEVETWVLSAHVPAEQKRVRELLSQSRELLKQMRAG